MASQITGNSAGNPPGTRSSNGASDTLVNGVHTSQINSLPLHYRGKVRDIYTIDTDHWLIIATDRVSAFDVILPDVVPGKGKLLTELALFWFSLMKPLVPNHLADLDLRDVLPDATERAQAEGRSMLVKRLQPVPAEAIVRGYLAGSGWLDYDRTGQLCGLTLPAGLQLAGQLPEPLFTPATKAAAGDHDENIDFATLVALIGQELAEQVRQVSLSIYIRAAEYTRPRGIVLADTKFEFGLDASGTLRLMDEILTPDSSRFWNAASWAPGRSPASYDKQFVRDWLETLDWNKTAPGPALPQSVIDGTLARYQEAVRRLTTPVDPVVP